MWGWEWPSSSVRVPRKVLPRTAMDDSQKNTDYAGLIYLMKNTMPHGGCSIISDIDDTIKISEVTDKKKLVVNTFKKDFVAVEGKASIRHAKFCLFTRTRETTGASFQEWLNCIESGNRLTHVSCTMSVRCHPNCIMRHRSFSIGKTFLLDPSVDSMSVLERERSEPVVLL